MIVSLPSREIGAAAIAAALLLAGCSSDSDVPPTVASAPGGGTQQNTDTGSGGSFPDVNSTPTQRPTSTIQDLNQAPEGLSGAQSGTQYGEPLVGGPTSSAEPPAPPPEPQQELAPIPEPGIKTQTSDAAPAETEPQPNYPAAAPEVAEAQPEPAAPAGEGQIIQGTMGEAQPQPQPEPEPQPEPQPAPVAAAPQQPQPEPQPQPQPMAPVGTPQSGAQPFQPEAQLALQPGSVQTPALGAAQPQLPASAYGPNYRALAPDAYGVSFPQPVLPPYQTYNPAQAMYHSPYANPPTNYGGATNGNGAPVISSQTAMVEPAYGEYGQQPYYGGGQPVGLIFFREGSSKLSSDDRNVLKQIAEMQRANGGMVHVVGHASMRTSTMDYARHEQANQRVSEARAKAVARQLMRYGVPEGAIQWGAAGSSQPLYAEVMPSGEAANRRAEVYLSAY